MTKSMSGSWNMAWLRISTPLSVFQGPLQSPLPPQNLLMPLSFLAARVTYCPGHIFGGFIIFNGTLYCASFSRPSPTPMHVSQSYPHICKIIKGRGGDQPFLSPSCSPELVKSLTSDLW